MSEDVAVYGRRGFALQPANMDEALRMAEMLAKSQMIPKAYQGKPQDALVAMMMGCELGLNPIQALQNIAVINGKPSIFGDALAALMLNHPAFGGMEEIFDDGAMTATCAVWRKGGARHTQTFSEADARKAGLWGKAGPWAQYPKRMLQMRARGFAIRGQFADALAGLITREEAEDMPGERNVTPAPNSVALDIPPAGLDPLASARQPAPLPATPATKLAIVINADGSTHSEHPTMGGWLSEFEALTLDADSATVDVLLGRNRDVLRRMEVIGMFKDRIARIKAGPGVAKEDNGNEL